LAQELWFEAADITFVIITGDRLTYDRSGGGATNKVAKDLLVDEIPDDTD